MALSEEPAASGSLVRARHGLGHLLAYFLGPGTAWGLQFEDLINQFLRENQRHNEKKRTGATSSLQKCCNRRTKLRNKFDAVSKAMEVITNALSHRKMEHRLNTLQTSLSMVERSIVKFKNLSEDCRMLEEEVHRVEEDEAHLEEEIRQQEEEEICQQEEEEICQQEEEEIRQQEEEEIANIKMVEEEEHGDPESSDPHGEADTEDPPPLVSAGDAISLEEDALLMQPAP